MKQVNALKSVFCWLNVALNLPDISDFSKVASKIFLVTLTSWEYVLGTSPVRLTQSAWTIVCPFKSLVDQGCLELYSTKKVLWQWSNAVAGAWDIAGLAAVGTVRTQHGPDEAERGLDWATFWGSFQLEVILQVSLFFSLVIEKSKCDGELRPGLCLWVVLKRSFEATLPSFPPSSLSPAHFSSLVNSVTMPYLKYLVIKCHCNSPRELFDISLLSFLTLNTLLCVLPLYFFGIYKVSGIQHRNQELKEKQNADMACDWRGDLFSFVPAAVSLFALSEQSLMSLLLHCDPVRQEAQGGVKWGCPFTHLNLREMHYLAAAK